MLKFFVYLDLSFYADMFRHSWSKYEKCIDGVKQVFWLLLLTQSNSLEPSCMLQSNVLKLETFNPYPANCFVQKMSHVLISSATYIQIDSRILLP